MKIVLSRKGFDSSSGGMPSPIFPDGKIFSLPIPTSASSVMIKDLNVRGYDIGEVLADISNQRVTPQQPVHLDPDLEYHLLKQRANNWRGAFGQIDIAQKHLSNKGVNKGDIFIFFGWFREIVKNTQGWRYKLNAPDLHVVFGWLIIDDVIPIYGNEKKVLEDHPWLKRHPHLCGNDNPDNTIYIGSRFLPSEICQSKPGFGVFDKIKDQQILTDTSQKKRSVWNLPVCFYPSENRTPLSYHQNKERWKVVDENRVTLNTVGRGQEFVIDTEYFPGIEEWLRELFG